MQSFIFRPLFTYCQSFVNVLFYQQRLFVRLLQDSINARIGSKENWSTLKDSACIQLMLQQVLKKCNIAQAYRGISALKCNRETKLLLRLVAERLSLYFPKSFSLSLSLSLFYMIATRYYRWPQKSSEGQRRRVGFCAQW